MTSHPAATPFDPLAVVMEFIESREPSVRRNVATALRVIGTEESVTTLVEMALDRTNVDISESLERELATVPESRHDFVRERLGSDPSADPRASSRARELLARLRVRGLWRERDDAATIGALCDAATGPDQELRRLARAELQSMTGRTAAMRTSEFDRRIQGGDALAVRLLAWLRLQNAVEGTGLTGASLARVAVDDDLPAWGDSTLPEASLCALVPASGEESEGARQWLLDALKEPARRTRAYNTLGRLRRLGSELVRPPRSASWSTRFREWRRHDAIWLARQSSATLKRFKWPGLVPAALLGATSAAAMAGWFLAFVPHAVPDGFSAWFILVSTLASIALALAATLRSSSIWMHYSRFGALLTELAGISAYAVVPVLAVSLVVASFLTGYYPEWWLVALTFVVGACLTIVGVRGATWIAFDVLRPLPDYRPQTRRRQWLTAVLQFAVGSAGGMLLLTYGQWAVEAWGPSDRMLQVMEGLWVFMIPAAPAVAAAYVWGDFEAADDLRIRVERAGPAARSAKRGATQFWQGAFIGALLMLFWAGIAPRLAGPPIVTINAAQSQTALVDTLRAPYATRMVFGVAFPQEVSFEEVGPLPRIRVFHLQYFAPAQPAGADWATLQCGAPARWSPSEPSSAYYANRRRLGRGCYVLSFSDSYVRRRSSSAPALGDVARARLALRNLWPDESREVADVIVKWTLNAAAETGRPYMSDEPLSIPAAGDNLSWLQPREQRVRFVLSGESEASIGFSGSPRQGTVRLRPLTGSNQDEFAFENDGAQVPLKAGPYSLTWDEEGESVSAVNLTFRPRPRPNPDQDLNVPAIPFSRTLKFPKLPFTVAFSLRQRAALIAASQPASAGTILRLMKDDQTIAEGARLETRLTEGSYTLVVERAGRFRNNPPPSSLQVSFNR